MNADGGRDDDADDLGAAVKTIGDEGDGRLRPRAHFHEVGHLLSQEVEGGAVLLGDAVELNVQRSEVCLDLRDRRSQLRDDVLSEPGFPLVEVCSYSPDGRGQRRDLANRKVPKRGSKAVLVLLQEAPKVPDVVHAELIELLFGTEVTKRVARGV